MEQKLVQAEQVIGELMKLITNVAGWISRGQSETATAAINMARADSWAATGYKALLGMDAAQPAQDRIAAAKAYIDRHGPTPGADRFEGPEVSGAVGLVNSQWPPLVFTYTNWRGEHGTRRAIPIRVYHGATEYHPEPQWLMEAHDLDKGAVRVFAMRDMGPEQDRPFVRVEQDGAVVRGIRIEPGMTAEQVNDAAQAAMALPVPAQGADIARELAAGASVWGRLCDHYFAGESWEMDYPTFLDMGRDAGLLVDAIYDPDAHGPINGDVEVGETVHIDSALGRKLRERACTAGLLTAETEGSNGHLD